MNYNWGHMLFEIESFVMNLLKAYVTVCSYQAYVCTGVLSYWPSCT